jgi:hypothetical protein
MLAAVEPVDHIYPLYVGVVDKVELPPLQIGFTVAFTVGVGNGFTVIVKPAVVVHPLLSVTVTV